MIEQRIFIPGMSRCGTTWISHWIAKHGDVAFLNEPHIMSNLYSFIYNKNVKNFVELKDVKQMIDLVYNKHAKGKKYLIDKSPGEFIPRVAGGSIVNNARQENMHISDFIHSIYPDAKVIVLYKDGKNYVDSVFHLPWKTEKNPDIKSVVNIWIDRIQNLYPKNEHNVMIIRYEDLIVNTNNIAYAISEFLGMKLPPLKSWEIPVNTCNHGYNADRWKRLPSEYTEEMKRMNPLLIKMGYDPVSI